METTDRKLRSRVTNKPLNKNDRKKEENELPDITKPKPTYDDQANYSAA